MNSGNPQFERDFEAFLEGGDSRLDALYRKLPQPEPDAQLDAAVRALAQRAVAAKERVPAAPHRRWLPAFAAAAVVVVAAGIALRLGPQMWQRPAPPASAEPTTAPAAPTGSPPPAAELSPAQTPPAQVSQPAPMADHVQAPVPAPAAKAAPQNLQKPENASMRQAPQAFPMTPPAMRRVAPASAAIEAKPSAAAAMRAKQTDSESAGTPAPALAAPAATDRNATLYPEHWLANIRQLLRNDQRDEALRSLAQFRKTYPDYRLPDDLRDLH